MSRYFMRSFYKKSKQFLTKSVLNCCVDWKEHYKPISNLLTSDFHFCVLTIAIAEERPPPRVFVYVTIACVALGGHEVGRLISGNFRKNPHIDLMEGSARDHKNNSYTTEIELAIVKTEKVRSNWSSFLSPSAPSRLKNISYQFVFEIILNFHQMET